MLIIKESQHCVQKQVKPCNSVTTAGIHKGTITRIKQALNSTGSMVGIAFCWGVMVCIRLGHADGGDSFPSDICACQTAHCHIQNMGS